MSPEPFRKLMINFVEESGIHLTPNWKEEKHKYPKIISIRDYLFNLIHPRSYK